MLGLITGSRAPVWVRASVTVFALAGLATDVLPARADAPAPEVVVHVADLPKRALYEFGFWTEPASPGGRMDQFLLSPARFLTAPPTEAVVAKPPR